MMEWKGFTCKLQVLYNRHENPNLISFKSRSWFWINLPPHADRTWWFSADKFVLHFLTHRCQVTYCKEVVRCEKRCTFQKLISEEFYIPGINYCFWQRKYSYIEQIGMKHIFKTVYSRVQAKLHAPSFFFVQTYCCSNNSDIALCYHCIISQMSHNIHRNCVSSFKTHSNQVFSISALLLSRCLS